jgi:hypothetical protein
LGDFTLPGRTIPFVDGVNKCREETAMNSLFQRFPGGLLVIDLRGLTEIKNKSWLAHQVQAQKPFTFALWICPARHWTTDQKELIAMIQTVRKQAGRGGITGPTALLASDFMPLDWVGPVRALASPIFGAAAEIEWVNQTGDSQRCSPLEQPPAFSDKARFVKMSGRRPKVDLL